MFNPLAYLGKAVHWVAGWRLDLFFLNLISQSAKLYKKLSDFEKELSKQISGIVAVINANLNQLPDFVFEIIQNYFPSVTKANLTKWLAKVNEYRTKADRYVQGTFQEELAKLQQYLNNVTGPIWIVATKEVLNYFVIAIAPTTILQKIEAVWEYVYQTYIKGKVVPA